MKNTRVIAFPERLKENLNLSAINFHLNRACNMHCKFCFATFNDLKDKPVKLVHQLAILEACAMAGVEKINFAGGEPTLIKHLPELLKRSKELGMITSLITNGALLTSKLYLEKVTKHLDILGVSIDSLSDARNIASGRMQKVEKQVLNEEDFLSMLEEAKKLNVAVKINTVVSQYNLSDDMSRFIEKIDPIRWKIFQVLPIGGQNDRFRSEYVVDTKSYLNYVERHRAILPHINIISETNTLMTDSYLMISPDGRFFDNTNGYYRYSSPILEVGFERAFQEIVFSQPKFKERDGNYFNNLAL